MTETITPWEFLAADGVGDWRVVGDGVCAFFGTTSFAEAARLVQAIGELPGLATRPHRDLEGGLGHVDADKHRENHGSLQP